MRSTSSKPSAVTRIVLCSGKVYFDLLKARRDAKIDAVAIVRLEQLYPFPSEEYEAILRKYENAREIVWCQEEPQNQGGWYQIRHRLQVAAWSEGRAACTRAAPAPLRPPPASRRCTSNSRKIWSRPRCRASRRKRPHDRRCACRRRLKLGRVHDNRSARAAAAGVGGGRHAWSRGTSSRAIASRATKIWSIWRPTRSCSRCRPRWPGVITEIKLKDGTTVTSGQLLALIEEAAAVPGASAPAVMAAATAPRRRRPGCGCARPHAGGRRQAGRQAEPRRQARGGGEQARPQGAGRLRARRTGIEIGRGEFPRRQG